MLDLSKWGPATFLVVAIVLLVVAAGGVVTVVHPESLAFDDYLKTLVGAAGAAGVLGIGRGLHASRAADDDSGGSRGEPELSAEDLAGRDVDAEPVGHGLADLSEGDRHEEGLR